ncbi:DUF4190 domain-containing protein [Kocuria sp.]|uniref:DUF4190 domain-containing protein n=1 Tax=Kocuria sp. TaxID=1871328 RepID=UPI0034A553D5
MHNRWMDTENQTPQTPSYPQTPQAGASYGQPVAGSSVAPQQTMPNQLTIVRQSSGPKGLSIASMVIGLVSIFLGFTFILPIIGFVLGLVGLKKEPAGRGMAITGVVLSGLILAIWAVLIFSGIGLVGLGLSNS